MSALKNRNRKRAEGVFFSCRVSSLRLFLLHQQTRSDNACSPRVFKTIRLLKPVRLLNLVQCVPASDREFSCVEFPLTEGKMLLKFALSVLLSLITLGSTQEVKVDSAGDVLALPKPSDILMAPKVPETTPCICGVFLSGQFNKTTPVRGNPVLMNEHPDHMACNHIGNKQCVNKCLDVLVKHLANSPAIICGAIDRDCYKERAYLFYKNCNDKWINSNLSAGREYCCKEGAPFKC